VTPVAFAVAACVLAAVVVLPWPRVPPRPLAQRLASQPGEERTRRRVRLAPVVARLSQEPRETGGAAAVGFAAGELGVLLRAGLPPPLAWAELARPPAHPVVLALGGAAAAVAERGGDVAAALRDAAREVGADAAPAVAGLGAVCEVAQRTGAPVADVLVRYAEHLGAEMDAQDAVHAALAAPRATAKVLLALPPVGLLLGTAVGADPVRVLVSTPAGRVSAAVGTACLLLAGIWTRRLLRSVREGPW
jgi:tight adherence protein B